MIPRATRSRTIEHNRRANHLFGANILLFFFRTYFGPFHFLAPFLLFEEVLLLLCVDRIINERAYYFCKFQFVAKITRKGCERQLFIPVERYRPHPKLNIRVEHPRQIQWLRPSTNIAMISLPPTVISIKNWSHMPISVKVADIGCPGSELSWLVLWQWPGPSYRIQVSSNYCG